MPYRLEYAKTARGACKMTECKKRDAKIPKGALKFGIWAQGNDTIGPFFVWRHWGCVTSKVLTKLNSELGDALEPDGFEELTEEDQDRVTTAMAVGHIAEGDKTSFTADEQRKHQDYLDDEERIKELRKEAKETGQAFNLKETREALKDQRLAQYKMEKDQAKLEEAQAKKAAKQAEKDAKVAKKNATVAARKRKSVKKEEDSDGSGDDTIVKPEPKKRRRANTGTVKTENEDEDSKETLLTELGPSQPIKSEEQSTEVEPNTVTAGAKKTSARVKHEDDTEDRKDHGSEEPPTLLPVQQQSKPKTTRGKKVIKAEPTSDNEAAVSEAKTKSRSTRIKKETKTAEGEDVDGKAGIQSDAPDLKPKAKSKATRAKKLVKTEDDNEADAGDLKAENHVTNETGRVLRRSVRNKAD